MTTGRHAAEWAAGGRRRRHLRLPKFTRKCNGMLRRRGPDQKNTSAPSRALEINASATRRLTQPAASADPRGHSKTHEASSRPHTTHRVSTPSTSLPISSKLSRLFINSSTFVGRQSTSNAETWPRAHSAHSDRARHLHIYSTAAHGLLVILIGLFTSRQLDRNVHLLAFAAGLTASLIQ